MTKIEFGKSAKWYSEHCSICKKTFTATEDRYKGHCIFKNDEELDFLACEKCAKSAEMSTAIQQTKELGKHDAHTTDLQPDNTEMPPDKPTDTKPVAKRSSRKRADKQPVEERRP